MYYLGRINYKKLDSNPMVYLDIFQRILWLYLDYETVIPNSMVYLDIFQQFP